jgi:chromosome segregation ATPase
MGLRKANAIRLDFDDLVKELDDFEQDIKTLQERIDQLITNARQKSVEAVAREGDMGTT